MVLAPLTKEFTKIDRYTRRALSRRKFAMRDFAAAQGRDAGGLDAWATTSARVKRRRPWQSKTPRALGDVQRFMEELDRESIAALEDYAAAIERNNARRWAAFVARTTEEKAPPENLDMKTSRASSLQTAICCKKLALQTFNIDSDISIG